MKYRVPNEKEIDECRHNMDRMGCVMQCLCALFFFVLASSFFFMEGGTIAGKIFAAIVVLVIFKKPIILAKDMVIENYNYQTGSYEVAEITINKENFGHRSTGGRYSHDILTYHVLEIEQVVDVVNEKSRSKLIHDKKALLIKMKLIGKEKYYMTHSIEADKS